MSRPKTAAYAVHPNGRLSDGVYRERISEQAPDEKHPVPGAVPTTVHPTLVRDAIRLVDFSGLVPTLERRMRSHLGFASQLTVRAMLVAIVCVGGELKKYLRTDIAKFFAGLDPQIAVDLGLQNLEGTLPAVSYNMVHKQFKRLEADLRAGWADDTIGQWCNGAWFSDQMLLATVPIHIRSRVTAVAVDGTDFPTHALCRIFDTDNDRLTDTVVDPEKEARRAAERRAKLGLPEPEDIYDHEETEETHSGGEPQPGDIGEDGRVIKGKDTEARVGHHSATNSRRAGFYLGYEVTPVVAVPGGAWYGDYDEYSPGDPLDGYILALGIAAAGTNPGPIGYKAIQAARRIAPSINEVVADRGFTTKRLTFNRPLHEDGIDVIMDYKQQVIDTPQAVQIGRRGDAAIMHAGTLLHPWTPTKWQTPAKADIDTIAAILKQQDVDNGNEPKTDAKYTELATQQWYAKRARTYAYVVHQHKDKGRKRVKCPVHAGKAAIPATSRTNANQSAVLIKVPNRHTGLCCEEGPVTVRADQLDQFQNIPYGTPAQQASYHRRNKVESVIGILKNQGGLSKQSCRAFGLIPRQIAATAIAVAYNMQLTRAAKEQAAAQRAADKAAQTDTAHNGQTENDTNADDDTQTDTEADLEAGGDLDNHHNNCEAHGGVPPPT